MTGHIHREAAAKRASPNQHFVGADYQPPEDSASVTKLFGQIPMSRERCDSAAKTELPFRP
jgi:hypothetical protein